ncbi:hypothetical protein [Marinicella rhabdoformis]|uniref:hypothetical protein n=1 Tax=Marinicella rhabdoformis TaxID=2580566 RepID=UPI0012AED66E|nr:hypothetical protein [Marinicella rhabdoformis]
MQAVKNSAKNAGKVVIDQSQDMTQAVTNDTLKVTEPKTVIVAEISYLQVYRKYQWAQLCQPYLNSPFRHKGDDNALVFDYSTHFLAQMTATQRRLGEPEVTSDEQLHRLDAYIAECDQVIAFVEKFESSQSLKANALAKSDPKIVLLNVLMDMAAESNKEKSIKAMLMVQQGITSVQAEIIALHQGENTWTGAEIAAQEQNIKNLMQQMAANAQNTVNNDELKQELKTLMQQLASQKHKDKTAIKYLIGELMALYAEANAKLKSIDSDVFYLAKTTAEMQSDYSGLGVLWYDFFRKEYGVQYTTPGERMLKLLGMSERHVLNQAAVPAGVLYLCALGEDCSENGLLMTSYCLGFGGFKKTEAACGKDLVTFYNSGYVSPALMQDVQLIMELMEVEYGS